MGSPTSGLITEAVMQSIEVKFMANFRPRLWLRYVDDTCAMINRNDLEHFPTIINSMKTNVSSSREAEQNNKLPFLYVLG